MKLKNLRLTDVYGDKIILSPLQINTIYSNWLDKVAKKNGKLDKHHALDAICISFSRDFKYDKEAKTDVIEGFKREDVKKVIDSIDFPILYNSKKPLKSNIQPEETIYGYRNYNGKSYITKRADLISIEKSDKKIKTIVDEVIKNDLLNKLELNLSANEWISMLANYTHPKKKTKVKKVLLVVSEGTLEKDPNGRDRVGEYADFAPKGIKHQFKRSKGHKGQILYYNDRGTVKVMPVYSNKKLDDVKDQLLKTSYKLYKNGQIFFSGCLVKTKKPFEGTVYYSVLDEEGEEKKTILK